MWVSSCAGATAVASASTRAAAVKRCRTIMENLLPHPREASALSSIASPPRSGAARAASKYPLCKRRLWRIELAGELLEQHYRHRKDQSEGSGHDRKRRRQIPHLGK